VHWDIFILKLDLILQILNKLGEAQRDWLISREGIDFLGLTIGWLAETFVFISSD
jgi:hypothetical protein